jgi:hypothetical protein
LLITTIALLSYALIFGNWQDYLQQFFQRPFVHLISLDFCLMCLIFPITSGASQMCKFIFYLSFQLNTKHEINEPQRREEREGKRLNRFFGLVAYIFAKLGCSQLLLYLMMIWRVEDSRINVFFGQLLFSRYLVHYYICVCVHHYQKLL